jgi:hypothetical protein
VVDAPGLLWRLQRLAVRDVQCWIVEAPSDLIGVRVIYGDETMLDAMYPDIQTARARAERLRSDLVSAGRTVMRKYTEDGCDPSNDHFQF